MSQDKERELLAQIGAILMSYGVRSVNMDDIARHLKMSKKTLYKYFKDKSEIVEKVTELHCYGEQCLISEISLNSENAIDEIIKISEQVNDVLRNLNPSVLFDLEKYYPESFKAFDNHKNTFVLGVIERNLERGITEGLYRENLNPKIIAGIYVRSISRLWDQEAFGGNTFSFAEIHLEMIRYHVRGVASAKGIEYLMKRINKEHIKL